MLLYITLIVLLFIALGAVIALAGKNQKQKVKLALFERDLSFQEVQNDNLSLANDELTEAAEENYAQIRRLREGIAMRDENLKSAIQDRENAWTMLEVVLQEDKKDRKDVVKKSDVKKEKVADNVIAIPATEARA